MRAKTLLKFYEEGRRDFRGVNLRGQSFRGKDLSGADFSGTDIRSADFTNACLVGAKFVAAQAGLQLYYQIGVALISLLLASISGLITSYTGLWGAYIISNQSVIETYTLFPGLALVSCSIAFYVILYYYELSFFLLIYSLSILSFVALVGTITMAVHHSGVWFAAGIYGFTLGVPSGLLILIVALVLSFFLGKRLILVLTLFLFFCAALIGVMLQDENGSIIGTILVATIEILAGLYISKLVFSKTNKLVLLKKIAIALVTMGGTVFRDANLTDVDFTNAILNSTDLRRANLTRTRWLNTIKNLDCVRPGKSYLDNPQTRELVRTGQGEGINCNRLDLQGVNLQGANLKNASFIEANLNSANLQDANLSHAKLVGTFLDKADLTGATLTGAFIEDWGITTKTILEGIKSDYVYMRLPPEKRPEFLKLTDQESLDENPHRQPADWKKNFEEGEFVDFITPMVETLDIYHNQGVDPRIVAYSFRELQEEHPEAELEIVSMERRGKNRQGLLIKAETAPEADHSELHTEYFDTYDRLKGLPPEQLRLLLVEREQYTKKLEAWVDTAVNRPGVNVEKYSNQGDTKMSENPGDKVDIKENYGVGINKGEIKDSKFARTIYESQEQNLAEAAKDIQELLEQLDKTYSSDTTAGKMKIATEVITQIDNNPTKAERIFSAIKAGGVAAVEQLLSHPASSFVIGALEDWQKSK